MTPHLFEALNRLASLWAHVMAAVAFQALVLAVLALLASRLLAHQSPALRHGFWLIVAFKLLIMPIWTLTIHDPGFYTSAVAAPHPGEATRDLAISSSLITSLPPSEGSGAFSETLISDSNASWALRWHIPWQASLMAVWVAGLAWNLARIARMRQHLNRCLYQAEPLEDARWKEFVAGFAARIGLRQAPRLAITDMASSPFVCGLVKPMLVLPRPLITALSADQWQPVIVHELAHVKRGDLVWSWIPELARIVLWFHPVAYWVAWRAQLERELACDGLAMNLAGVPASAYAQTLINVLSFSPQEFQP